MKKWIKILTFAYSQDRGGWPPTVRLTVKNPFFDDSALIDTFNIFVTHSKIHSLSNMYLFWMGYSIHSLNSSSVHQFIHIFLKVAHPIPYEDFVHGFIKKQIGFLCVRQICRCAKVGKVGNRICAKLFSGSVQCRRRRRGPIIWYSCLSLPRYSPKGKYTHRHNKHTHTHTLRHTSTHTHKHVHVHAYTITHKSTNTHTQTVRRSCLNSRFLKSGSSDSQDFPSGTFLGRVHSAEATALLSIHLRFQHLNSISTQTAQICWWLPKYRTCR